MSVDAFPRETLADSVVATIAEVTRYPRSILRPEAELEEELGIESVKRAEILAVLGQRLQLPPPQEGSLGQLKTVGDVIAAVERAMAAQAGVTAPAPAPVAAPAAPARPPARPTTSRRRPRRRPRSPRS
jgi:enoyl-[acyl-carrier protein] reductase III